jgi:hypothetical protein
MNETRWLFNTCVTTIRDAMQTLAFMHGEVKYLIVAEYFEKGRYRQLHPFWNAWIAWMILASTCALAQVRDTTLSAVPGSAIKVSPLHLINFYPTVQVSYEQRIFPRFTLQAEGGYVMDYGNDEESFQNRRGMKLKLEGRYYLGSVSTRANIHYVSMESYMNMVDFDRYGIVEECFDEGCNHPYVRRFPYKMEYMERGISLKAGVIWYVSSRFFVDGNGGLTLRNIDYHKPPLPARIGHKDDWSLIEIPNETDRLAVSPNMGVRIGYRFK